METSVLQKPKDQQPALEDSDVATQDAAAAVVPGRSRAGALAAGAHVISSKVLAVMSAVRARLDVDPTAKFVIFSQFVKMLDLLELHFDKGLGDCVHHVRLVRVLARGAWTG